MFEYLVNVLLPKASKGARSHAGGHFDSIDGVFITGPPKFMNSIAIPIVHIYNRDECQRLQLVLYKIGPTVFGMFFEGKTLIFLIQSVITNIRPSYLESAKLTDVTYHELHTTLSSQLNSIGTAISESQANRALTELSIGTSSSTAASGPRFLFLNELNLKHTGTLHINPFQQSSKLQSTIPNDVMNLLADLFTEASDADAAIDPVAEETVVKTLNDYWIVRRSSNWRHFFVVVNKSSTLLSVTEEARAIFDEHAKNVFFDK